MTSETHTMTAPDSGATVKVNPELVDYLRTRPEVRPLRDIFRNAIFVNGAVSIITTAPIICSGINDIIPIDHILLGGHMNWFRIAQGALGTANLLCQNALQIWGRYHTYKDMSDLQKGIDPAIIIDRADIRNHSRLHNTLSGWAVNSVNFTAKFAMGMCGLMFMSGLASGRWGESIAAVLIVPAMAVRLVPEKTSPDRAKFDFDMAAAKNKSITDRSISEHGLATLGAMISSDSHINKGINLTVEFMRKAFYKAGLSQAKAAGSTEDNFLQKLATRPPLFISGLYNTVKRIPDAVNAGYLVDWPKIWQHGGGFIGDVSIMGVDKRYVGRSKGSILTAVDGPEVAKNILEGRIIRNWKELFGWAPPEQALKI